MSNSHKLALFGGPKAVPETLPAYNPIGLEELEAAKKVVESTVLSRFVGAACPDFNGGDKVNEFEAACADYFGVKHAITVNSWTSGLIAAVGALGIEPGDEVIVSPWTMCASATAILHWNAIPVFADIDPDTFCIDPKSIEKNISPYTKAIMAVDIFGHPADMDAIREIADRYNLKVISDSAQAPGVFYKGKMAGTLADIGGYSLNYHKHIHTGEGGILVTNDDRFAERLKLIRNHAEAVITGEVVEDLTNMVGYNFRLGEVECAIGLEQLKKLSNAVKSRQRAASRLTDSLQHLNGLTPPIVAKDCTSSFYFYGMIVDFEKLGVTRERIAEALVAEGVEGLSTAYQNLHLLPMYQRKIAFGSKGFPWTSDICHRKVSYDKGICPVAEKYQDSCYLGLFMCMKEYRDEDVDKVVAAFEKVWRNLELLA
ncbi:DegT/DnrJ/EryC1/StrS aminotransferase family protein [Marinobacterium sp. LSUCC0821]|uniref:DegT/DnrJ/EryC1/StrS family aminotransferase n=1 Tax=Marinobacterium sp. LSUCC0821 TaxID=2668067 RepID=UPI001451B77D|nr:DegT/DnrJ/EryC1/StrS family aminotransferase [Marinobacterium sp. LSUCC0821]QJD72161.1 DegT/DnrJ/EryC1/StrS family aminotransferase [Marinobacterium sp. LSUCC0821]